MMSGDSIPLWSRRLFLVVAFAVWMVWFSPLAAGHNPHGDCTHAYWQPYDIIQGGDNSFDQCNGLEFAGPLMYAYGADDVFRGLGGTDEIHGGTGDDMLTGDGGDDEVVDKNNCGNSCIDSDDFCDGGGFDHLNSQDGDVYQTDTDFLYRSNDGVPGEPTTKDAMDVIFYMDRSDCPPWTL